MDLSQLAQKVDHLESLLKALGVPTEQWLSPNEAAKLISIGRSVIMKEINLAEESRVTGGKPDLEWGKHYRKVQNNWQIEPYGFSEVVTQPPEYRSVG